jgi:Integrase zinc binding domain
VGDTFCPVIPTSDSTSINVILSDLHSSALGGHLGFKKLLKAVSTRFYWKGMYLTVKTFIKRCGVC